MESCSCKAESRVQLYTPRLPNLSGDEFSHIRLGQKSAAIFDWLAFFAFLAVSLRSPHPDSGVCLRH
jgi:hypothetical protein